MVELKYTSRKEVFGGKEMDSNKSAHIEDIIFNYFDEFKVLFFPDQWSDIFLDYSKSEILTLLYLYRYKNANMTQIAEYIIAPLNTTTGVISRLEKKQLVERIRSAEDRRIVYITLTDKAIKILEKEKTIIIDYINKINNRLTGEERDAVLSILKKVIGVFRESENKPVADDKSKSKIKRIIVE